MRGGRWIKEKEDLIDEYLRAFWDRRLHFVPGDGDCAFHSLAFHTGLSAPFLRWATGTWISIHERDEPNPGSGLTWSASIELTPMVKGGRNPPWRGLLGLIQAEGRAVTAPVVAAMCAMLGVQMEVIACTHASWTQWTIPNIFDPVVFVMVHYSGHFCPSYLIRPLAARPATAWTAAGVTARLWADALRRMNDPVRANDVVQDSRGAHDASAARAMRWGGLSAIYQQEGVDGVLARLAGKAAPRA